MHPFFHCLSLFVVSGCLVSCAVVPESHTGVPGESVRRMVLQRSCVVVVSSEKSWSRLLEQQISSRRIPKDVEGGSATPITSDGYFITASHVLENVGQRQIYVLYGSGEDLQVKTARIIWRDRNADVVLMHVPIATPKYYQWTPSNLGVKAGTTIVHGGFSTGSRIGPGEMLTDLWPETWITSYRKFKMDLALEPGDSGGPVVDGSGQLLGINSAVEYLVPMETPYFVDSEAVRPNVQKLEKLISADRMRTSNHVTLAE